MIRAEQHGSLYGSNELRFFIAAANLKPSYNGRIVQLLEQPVDAGANLRIVAELFVLAVGDEQRIQRHGGLLGRALALLRDSVAVGRDALQQTQRLRRIEFHAVQTRAPAAPPAPTTLVASDATCCRSEFSAVTPAYT